MDPELLRRRVNSMRNKHNAAWIAKTTEEMLATYSGRRLLRGLERF